MTEHVADPIGAAHAEFSSFFVEAADGVRLRVLHWQPREAQSADPLVFVAGWVSVVGGWAEFLFKATRLRPVYYIETREKNTAQVDLPRPRPDDFGMRQLARDLVAVSRALPINLDRTIFVASSFGATALLEALKHGALAARAAFLIGPNSDFKAPPVVGNVIYLPAWLYHGFKHILLWYLRTFRVDAKKEPEQMARYDATLRSANPRRLQLSAIAVLKYSVWKDLDTIGAPVAMAFAGTDKLHSAANIVRMVETIPPNSAIDFL